MPPKPKFTRQEIAAAALDMIKTGGVEALTARNLGSRLGSSARPIFTLFKNMEEVKQAARDLALREFEDSSKDFTEYTPAFKQVGMQMVSYAVHKPELYKLLFMQEYPERQTFAQLMGKLGGIAEDCVEVIQRDYAMTEEEARLLFEQVWVQTFGLGALCAMKVCDFTEEEIAEKLGQVFAAAVLLIKSGKAGQCSGQPVRETEKEEAHESSHH